jgi:hypothetical protein
MTTVVRKTASTSGTKGDNILVDDDIDNTSDDEVDLRRKRKRKVEAAGDTDENENENNKDDDDDDDDEDSHERLSQLVIPVVPSPFREVQQPDKAIKRGPSKDERRQGILPSIEHRSITELMYVDPCIYGCIFL